MLKLLAPNAPASGRHVDKIGHPRRWLKHAASKHALGVLLCKLRSSERKRPIQQDSTGGEIAFFEDGCADYDRNAGRRGDTHAVS